ncbi:NUDIX domain-containing protein [Candidatus Woesearchaeota archaeon]|nr:NUDIX domain-containing protein [Candidatus Woesearchaeota archaeon]
MNKVIISSAFVENNKGEYLLVKEIDSKKWKIPSETIKPAETPEEGIKRGIKEETGYLIEIVKLLDHYFHSGSKGDILERFDYHAKVSRGKESRKKDEISALKWVSLDALEEMFGKLPNNHVYKHQINKLLEYI